MPRSATYTSTQARIANVAATARPRTMVTKRFFRRRRAITPRSRVLICEVIALTELPFA